MIVPYLEKDSVNICILYKVKGQMAPCESPDGQLYTWHAETFHMAEENGDQTSSIQLDVSRSFMGGKLTKDK